MKKETGDVVFLRYAKRALERLKPRMLSSGAMINHTRAGATFCAIGAVDASGYKGRIAPNFADMSEKKRIAKPYPSPSNDGDGDLVSRFIGANEHFRPLKNGAADQRDRWEHVHTWVCSELARRGEGVE